MAEIVLRDVEKYFGDNYIIRKLNLTIQPQEFVVLLGPSGCGKTTTLRALAGLEEIDRGTILIDGRPVQHLRASERDIAFVFQMYALYPHLTAFENIAFPLRASGQNRVIVDSRVRQVAKSLEIGHLLRLRPSALSGGDMQRVAIARALVRQHKALLMDEPLGALDAKLREAMRAELKRLHIENSATTIYVTHDQVEAMALADRIAIMNEGVLQQVGEPAEVYQHPANLFVAQFIGSPVMNVSEVTVAAAGDRTILTLGDDDGTFELATPSVPATLRNGTHQAFIGVRPEAVLLSLHEEAPLSTNRASINRASRMEAHIIEPLGAYDIVDLSLGKQFLRARTSSGFVGKPGTPVWARLDESQVHFFDKDTGQSLRSEARG
jgi:multiple sugar transport system ATP-binding protein